MENRWNQRDVESNDSRFELTLAVLSCKYSKVALLIRMLELQCPPSITVVGRLASFLFCSASAAMIDRLLHNLEWGVCPVSLKSLTRAGERSWP